jgi:hypothetical protein
MTHLVNRIGPGGRTLLKEALASQTHTVTASPHKLEPLVELGFLETVDEARHTARLTRAGKAAIDLLLLYDLPSDAGLDALSTLIDRGNDAVIARTTIGSIPATTLQRLLRQHYIEHTAGSNAEGPDTWWQLRVTGDGREMLAALREIDELLRRNPRIAETMELLPDTTPTAEQVNAIAAFIDRCGREDRERVYAIDEVDDQVADGVRRIETGLHIAAVHLAGTALYVLTKDPHSDDRLLAMCWEALTKTAQTWAEHPAYPDFLPKPEWAES